MTASEPTPAPRTDPIVGIDLGTTNSLVAIADRLGPRVIPDAQGRALLPSVVRYGAEGLVVGHEARDTAAEFPRVTISSAKRLMGRSLEDARPDLPFLPYEVVAGPHNTARIALPTRGEFPRLVSPQEVASVVLRTLRDQASAALGTPVKRAVVTVPAYFDDAQRQATRDAGRIAGLEVVRIVNEPTAAALAYGLGLDRAASRNRPDQQTIVVFDLGGGTFDVSVLRLIPTPEDQAGPDADPFFFQVLSTAGDTHLGGDDLDHAIVGAWRAMLAPELSPSDQRRLLAAAEQAKRELSERDQTVARVALESGERMFELSRTQLEALAKPLIDRTLVACRRALADAKIAWPPAEGAQPSTHPIDAVILVGGQTRMPAVRRAVREFFGLEPYTALDPDQVVALGAAVQASILGGVDSGLRSGALLLDVIPLSLGLETVGGAAAKLIVRNATVPARATEQFSTSVDNQTAIRLHVVQGEREMAGDCRSLGVFVLRIPPMPAGIPRVEVEFLVDANGVLTISAIERRSGRTAGLQVIPNHGLTEEEVHRMEAESLAHAAEDLARHRIVDLTANSKLDAKWIRTQLERFGPALEIATASDLMMKLQTVEDCIARAERDWRSVDAGWFASAKDQLDRASVRLQELAIAESLRQQG